MKLFLSSVLIFWAISIPIFSETISIAADPWMPLTGDAKSDKQGYLIEIAKKVFEAKGITVEYKTINWARAIEESRKGNITAIAGAYKTDAPDFVFTSNPLGMVQDTFFVLKGNPWKYKDIPSLESITLGVTNGYSYGDEVDAYIKKNQSNPKKVQPVTGEEPLYQNLQKLEKGRINAVLDAKMVVSYLVKDRSLKIPLEEAGFSGKNDVYIAFSPKNPKSKEYAALLNEGVESLRKNNQLQPILEKYGLTDWAK